MAKETVSSPVAPTRCPYTLPPLQGTYIDSDALWSRLAALERQGTGYSSTATAAANADELLAMVATTKRQEYVSYT